MTQFNPQNPAAFTAHWRKFYDQGFSIIPVIRKAPWQGMDPKLGSKGWTKFCEQRPDLDTLSDWSARVPRMAGIGICCGLDVGDDMVLVAIDIDMRDPDDISAIQSTLPGGTMSKFGEKGLTLLYRCEKKHARTRNYRNDPKKPPLVELLGLGRQTVMPPTIHPDTRRPYEWRSGADLRIDELPILTEDHITEMEEMLSTYGWDRRFGYAVERGAVRTRDEDIIEGSFQDTNARALDNIPAWVEELNLYRGIWRGARFAAVNTFRDSGKGRDARVRKRNLSIHPQGIVDFGTGEGYSPIDLVMLSQGCDEGTANNWLCERVDPNWAIKQALHLTPPVPKLITTPATVDTTPAVVKPRVDPDAAHKVAREMGPLPESCFDNAPGFIGRLAREVRAGSPKMPKTLALTVAISAMSALCARRYVGETRGNSLYLTVYAVAMSETGGGKDHAINFGSRLLHACAQREDPETFIYDYGHPADRLDQKKGGVCSSPIPSNRKNAFDIVNAASDFTGDSALISTLWSCATPWLRIDEFGSVFSNWAVGRSQTTPITTLLRKYYSKAAPQVGKAYAINQTVSEELRRLREKPLQCPAITVLGVTTPEQMYDALDNRMAEDGTINRFIIAHEDASRDTLDETYDQLFGDHVRTEIHEDIVTEAIEIFTCGQRTTQGALGMGYHSDLDNRLDVFCDPRHIVVEADGPETRRAMAQFIQARKESRFDDTETGQVVARVGENMLRLAYLAAVGDNANRAHGVLPEARIEHVQWAIGIMQAVEANLKSLITEHMGGKEEKERSRDEQRVISHARTMIEQYQAGQFDKLHSKSTVRENGWVVQSHLQNKFGSRNRERFIRAIKNLRDSGAIEIKSLDKNGKQQAGAPPCIRFYEFFEDC